ncbi:hypothetical protein GCM10008018_08490 [Paenibacillus marchantiophytorum]|uniref:Aldehyde dehydrogenase domain-containing protein n=1 Tax=Paenibacillus marchantiophytorum TaxID=1619310 RepID=A0ABQ2BPV3_9BACL|nr:hypothetical protein GCM10008018_08490 [Paenibacillus marchantiophytorum]
MELPEGGWRRNYRGHVRALALCDRCAFRVAEQIEVGLTWVNTWFLRDPRTPYGGVKESGIGRQGGMYSIDFYSDISTICMKY